MSSAQEIICADVSRQAKVRIEVALRDSDERLAGELAGMTRLHELSMRLVKHDDLKEVMREVMEAAADLLGADRCTAQLLDKSDRTLHLAAVKGFDDDFAGRFKIITQEGYTTCAAALGRCERVIVEDLATKPEFAEFASLALPMGIAAVMSTPLLALDGTLLGIFTTYWPRPHVPNEHQLRLLDLYVQQAARQVERRAAEQALRESEEKLATQVADLETLRQLSLRVAATEDRTTALNDILATAISMVGAAKGNVQLFDAANDSLEIIAHRGFDDEFLAYFKSVPSGYSCCGAAVEKRERILIEDVFADLRFRDLGPRYARHGFVAVQSTPLLAADGRLLGMFSTHFANPHRFSERDLRLLDQIAQQAGRVIERAAAEDALREANRRKDEFLATLAHELRNPLAPIRSGLEVMRLAKNDPQVLDQIHGTMSRQTDQLVRLIDDLMDVSRITRGKLKLQRKQVELEDIVKSAVEATVPIMEEKGHRLTVELPPGPTLIEVDPHRMTQVLCNLLQNAAKYSPDPGPIQFAAKNDNGQVVLSVKDHGLGIPPDKLEEVFEMFAQIGRSAQSGYTGLGIGLTLAKSLVEMHGGFLEAKSEGIGQGAEFLVRLPDCLRQPKASDGNIADNAEQATAKQRVLVVDDNEDAARMLGMTVKILGHEAIIACDGAEAIAIASDFQPDIVLLDLGMPRMDGYETAAHMRQTTWGKDAVLVALTGWGQDEDRRRTKAAGFNHHIVKPAEHAALLAIFEECQMAANRTYTQ